VAEGARLESVYTGNRIAGSNPAPSASLLFFLVFHREGSTRSGLSKTGAHPSSLSARSGRSPNLASNIETGTFAEFGVGNGLENNTLILLASGWRGFWIDGQI
jgi:hypothetical protein